MAIPPCETHTVYTRRVVQGGFTARCVPLQCCLFTPELQWQSRGKQRAVQGGGSPLNAWASCRMGETEGLWRAVVSGT
jgi:hypothetical protein